MLRDNINLTSPYWRRSNSPSLSSLPTVKCQTANATHTHTCRGESSVRICVCVWRDAGGNTNIVRVLVSMGYAAHFCIRGKCFRLSNRLHWFKFLPHSVRCRLDSVISYYQRRMLHLCSASRKCPAWFRHTHKVNDSMEMTQNLLNLSNWSRMNNKTTQSFLSYD